MTTRTRALIAIVLVVAIVVVGILAFVWWVVSRPGTGPNATNPPVTLSPVQAGLSWPIALGFASDSRVFYAERFTGSIRIIEGGAVLPTPFFTLPNTATAGERGLLGLALDPGFPSTPYVYAYQTYNDIANASTYNRIVRIRASGDIGVSSSVILYLPLLSSATNHNGGVIAFGPDGKLWVLVGENANPSLSQTPPSPMGKVLRLNPDGSAPTDNPFYNNASWNPLVYTYGHRNMFGIAFHPVSGRAYITENGPACNDEVNLLTPGSNYGWGPKATCSIPPLPPMNTNQDGTNPVMPIDWWGSTIAPTNAAFYTGSLLPASQNDFMFGAYNDRRLRDLRLSPDGTAVTNETVLLTAPDAILDVEMGRDRFLWITTPSAIYRIVAAPTIMPAVGVVPTVASVLMVALPLEISGVQRLHPDPFAARVHGPPGNLSMATSLSAARCRRTGSRATSGSGIRSSGSSVRGRSSTASGG